MKISRIISKTLFGGGVLIIVLLFSHYNNAFASVYSPGQTLNPDCAMGSSNCGVVFATSTESDPIFEAASSTFLSTTSAAIIYLPFNYASSTFPTFAYASSSYLLLSASNTLPYIPFASSSLYVPYTGATSNVNLNNQNLLNLATLSVGTTTLSSTGIAFFNGKVGIGTSTPGLSLTVVGTTTTDSLIINNSCTGNGCVGTIISPLADNFPLMVNPPTITLGTNGGASTIASSTFIAMTSSVFRYSSAIATSSGAVLSQLSILYLNRFEQLSRESSMEH